MEKLPVWIGPFGDQPVDLYAKGGTYLPTSLDKVYSTYVWTEPFGYQPVDQFVKDLPTCKPWQGVKYLCVFRALSVFWQSLVGIKGRGGNERANCKNLIHFIESNFQFRCRNKRESVKSINKKLKNLSWGGKNSAATFFQGLGLTFKSI